MEIKVGLLEMFCGVRVVGMIYIFSGGSGF